MDFLWFDFLALLLLLPVLVAIYILALRRRRPAGVRYSSLALIRDAGPGSSRVRRHLPFALFIVALGALVMAMARPVAIVAVPTNQTTIVLTIDVSGSMCSSDIPPSRLEAAEAAAAAFINSQSSTTRIGIVAFSSYAEVVQAPTNDKSALLAALKSLATGRRTAIGDGILASIDTISEIDPGVAKSATDSSSGTAPAPVPKGDYAPDIVVLLTDGASNTGTDPLDAAQQAADRGVRVYTIGFGGGGGGGGGNFRRGIDEATLQKIADMTGATYHPASTASELQSVFQNLPVNLIVKHETAEVSVVFVGAGALIAALAFLLGKIWRPLP